MNYYEVLRIQSNASISEIKNAYKRLVKKYHPDIYEGNKLFAERKIKEINEAYETLSEKEKKEIYDAELNYKKYEPKIDSFVKTYSKEDINNYTKIYYNNSNKKAKNKTEKKIENKKSFDLNSIGKKYFFKLDKALQTDEKENLLIILLLLFIIVLCFGVLKFII